MEIKKDSKIEQGKNITIRQAGLIVLCVILAFKVILFPASIGNISGGGLWLSYLINGFITIIVLWFTILVIKKQNGKDLETTLNEIFGKIITKILLIVLFVFFISKLLFFNGEVKSFLSDTLYFELNWNFFVIPILLLIGFLVYKGMRVIGRTAEIFVAFALIALFISIIFSFSNIDAENLGALFTFEVGPLLEGVLGAFSRAGDFLFLLIVMDKLKINNKQASKDIGENKNKSVGDNPMKIFKYGVFGVILTTVFLIICELVFGLEVSNISDSIIKITNFTGGANSIFKLDGIIILFWFPMLVLYSAVNLYSAVWCLKKIFNAKSTFWAVGIAIVLTYIFNFLGSNTEVVLTISNQVLPWLTVGIEAFVIILAVIVLAKNKKKLKTS